jgi:hypothetical protein
MEGRAIQRGFAAGRTTLIPRIATMQWQLTPQTASAKRGFTLPAMAAAALIADMAELAEKGGAVAVVGAAPPKALPFERAAFELMIRAAGKWRRAEPGGPSRSAMTAASLKPHGGRMRRLPVAGKRCPALAPVGAYLRRAHARPRRLSGRHARHGRLLAARRRFWTSPTQGISDLLAGLLALDTVNAARPRASR